MTARTVLRAPVATLATAALVTSTVVTLPAPALASLDDGEVSGDGLTALETLLIFVAVPGALFLAIALLVAAPSMARGPRYRPGLGWWAAPVWFNGPDDADAAVRAAAGTKSEGGGASARW